MAYTPKNPNGQTTMANSAPVVIASDQSAIAVYGSSTNATAGSAFYAGNRAATALPTAATAGNLTGVMSDKFGRTVIVTGTIRDLVKTQTTTLSNTETEQAIVNAEANVFNDLTALVVTNTSTGTATRIDFRDTTAGTVLFSLFVPPGDMRGIAFQRPVPQTTANRNWTAQCAPATTDIIILAVFDRNR